MTYTVDEAQTKIEELDAILDGPEDITLANGRRVSYNFAEIRKRRDSLAESLARAQSGSRAKRAVYYAR